MNTVTLTWQDVSDTLGHFLRREHRPTIDAATVGVYGIPRGGIPLACLLSGTRPAYPYILLDRPTAGCLIVDDLVDHGATLRPYLIQGHQALVLGIKQTKGGIDLVAEYGPQIQHCMDWEPDDWVVFPWETTDDGLSGPEDAVRRIIRHVGDDPDREGLRDTPRRYLKALRDMAGGSVERWADEHSRTFPEKGGGYVVVDRIPFTALCEHHMLPFTGTVSVGYSYLHRVVGLSKIPRLVGEASRRLTTQERIGRTVALNLSQTISPDGKTPMHGVVVAISASHSCMCGRGPKAYGATTTTRAVSGNHPQAIEELKRMMR